MYASHSTHARQPMPAIAPSVLVKQIEQSIDLLASQAKAFREDGDSEKANACSKTLMIRQFELRDLRNSMNTALEAA